MEVLQCPVTEKRRDEIVSGHGGGGRMTRRLIEEIFRPAFGNPLLNQNHDATILSVQNARIAFTTDSFVVDPIFFPGGDIGDLAVNGTVNDLLCSGATPLYLSAGFILEEGFPIETLRRIVESMRLAAARAGVSIVTGDTKVVERGKGDQIYINTSGIGIIPDGIHIGLSQIRKGDVVLVTGEIGNHGTSVLSARENLGFESIIQSDTAALTRLVSNLLGGVPGVRFMRDPTRGGLSATLNEVAEDTGVTITIDEEAIPVSDPVAAACDLLGIDPLGMANEGVLLIVVAKQSAEQALSIIRNSPHGRLAACIGSVTSDTGSCVELRLPLGQTRVLEMMSGEQLPRIC